MFTRPFARVWRAGLLVLIAILLVLGWRVRHRFAPPEAGSPAPSYSANNLDGQPVSLADFRGKVVVLNAWATWCPPCIKEMPALERLYRELKAEGLEVVAVSVDSPLGSSDPMGNPGGDVRAFAQEFGLSFPILLDPKRTIQQIFPMYGLPTTIIIDRAGRIVRISVGPEAWDDDAHEREFRRLLAVRP